ncbi:MAG: hypothetical protein CHACPFDD_00166 [Phycisphaerae bacterium]|nr:hypothetical protein [Phycisphaerae bacterium]
MNRRFAAATLAALVIAPFAVAHDDDERCLLVSAVNLAQGRGNWFTYIQISDAAYTIEKGDHLEFDIYLPTDAPVLKGGVDADLRREGLPELAHGRTWMRDCGLVDQNGIRQHGDGILEPAKGKWYHRAIDLTPLAGATTTRWNVVFEGDEPGRHSQLLDNIRVTHDGATRLSIYENGKAPEFRQRQTDGYSRTVFLTAVPREASVSEEKLGLYLDAAKRAAEMHDAQQQFRSELDVARQLAATAKDDKLLAELDAVAKSEDLAAFAAGDTAAYFESLHQARHRLGHAHPVMQKFTGHLVGHAHIDLQWLWTWDETVKQIIPETFGQALKFMKEYPDFTFSQSSATLYETTEKHHPEIFKGIQEYVAAGRWELVGGRWCEGDTNMISPESHVRHLLYGQRYFQQKFGRTCTVGWEPDTFGHTWTLPQILKKSGIDYYYFCRAGKNVPLFWWEGPDGSRVLAFEEPATGGWYNDVVNDEKVRELAKFVTQHGVWEHLMVYGVGNHGGGPTREYIEAALAMRKRGLWPTIKFSTASEFFKKLAEQVDPAKIPVIRDELNPVFEGCYTSHSRIKKYNRDSEMLLECAEVFGTLAAIGAGESTTAAAPAAAPSAERFVYPRADFENMWRDVCWNHHHDTLPGSFIHKSAEYSYEMYEQIAKRGSQILHDARRKLLAASGIRADSPIIYVFNPLAWTRGQWVEAVVRVPAATERVALSSSDDKPSTPHVLERRVDGETTELRICFHTGPVQGCGWRAFQVIALPLSSPDGTPVAPERQAPAAIDPATARDVPIRTDKPAAVYFQVQHEKPHGMSAWELGPIERTITLDKPEKTEVLEASGARTRIRETYRFDKSTITQTITRYCYQTRADYETVVDWQQVGNANDGGPMLSVVIPTDIQTDNALHEIPFGDISRKTNGKQSAALKWCAVTGGSRTVAVLNDCKHAYDVKDGAIRLTLLRASYEPDPVPDVGVHHIRYSVVPMDGAADRAALVRAGWEFNKPLQVVVDQDGNSSVGKISMDVPPSEPARVNGAAGGRAAPRGLSGSVWAWCGLSAEPANIIVTSLKLSEDGDDVIIRAYECAGQPAQATFTLGFDARSAAENDLIEREMKGARPVTLSARTLSADFKPHEIRTFRVRR